MATGRRAQNALYVVRHQDGPNRENETDAETLKNCYARALFTLTLPLFSPERPFVRYLAIATIKLKISLYLIVVDK